LSLAGSLAGRAAAKGLRAQQAARYATTQANLARIKPLAAMNAVSQKDLDDATGADLSAKAALEAADRLVGLDATA